MPADTKKSILHQANNYQHKIFLLIQGYIYIHIHQYLYLPQKQNHYHLHYANYIHEKILHNDRFLHQIVSIQLWEIQLQK